MKLRWSLRWKVTATIAAGGVLVAVLAAGGFCALDLRHFERDTTAQAAALSAVVAEQVPPAVALNDPKAANETLAALRRDPLIQEAILYDVAGRCFAAYHRVSNNGCRPVPRDGVQALNGTIMVSRPVADDEGRLGTLALVVELPSVFSLLRQFLSGAALIILLSCAAALIIGIVLQARIAAPVLRIADVARRIAQTHHYNERVAEGPENELGQLARSFNSMLDEIGRRDDQLAAQRCDLEEQVTERNRVNAELRLAKEKAEEAARLKSEFLANMSHEIRTPMNAVIGMISLVLDQTTGKAEREQLEVAHNAARSLVTILNDILDLSKMEAGKLVIESVPCNLKSLIQESVRIFAAAAEEKGLDIGVNLEAGCPESVASDPVRLRQIVMNLVGNALKFTPRGGVRVTVRRIGRDWVRFEVRETGIGVPPEKLETIFESFTQADGSHTRQYGGTGLGLTITQRLVHLMGGSVWVESRLGEGSTFFVDLPLMAVDPPEAAESPKTATESIPALRVLVAEDNPVNQRVVTAMLKRQGHSVTLVQNGDEAYQSYLAGRFDLVLMDIQMPEVDGLQATRLIREEEARRGASDASLRGVPILALTAHASGAQRDQCLAAGMDGVLIKPIDLVSLASAVAHAAAKANPVLQDP